MSGFSWNDPERGERIEDFIHKMTCARPALMREVLAIGLGDLNHWTDTGVVVGAKCGCLIGTCALAAVRLYEDFDATQVFAINNDREYVHVVPMTLATAIAGGSRRKADLFSMIGGDVAFECDPIGWSDAEYEERSTKREAEVRAYLADLIATDLRLLKVPVPRAALI